MLDTYVEVIGSVVDISTIKMMAVVNLGPELGARLSPNAGVRPHPKPCRHETRQRDRGTHPRSAVLRQDV